MKTAKCKNCEIEFTYKKGNRLFCSKKCSKKYHLKIHRVTDHEWGSLTATREKEKQKKIQEYTMLLNTHYTRDWLESNNINIPTMERFLLKFNIQYEIKKINITYRKNEWGGGITNLYDKESCNLYKNFLSTFEVVGYRTEKYILEKLSIAKDTFKNYKNNKFLGLGDPIVFVGCSLYEQSNADAWINDVLAWKNKTKELEEIFRQEANAKKELIRQEVQKRKHERKHKSNLKKQQKKLEKEQIKAQKKLEKANKPKFKKKAKIIKREDDWTSWENYEARLKIKLSDPLELAKIRSEKSININLHYHSEHDIGNVICLSCKDCNLSKPYYDFHFSQSMSSGRNGTCKECARTTTNKNKPTDKQKDSNQFLIQFATSIKRELSKKNGKYYEIKIKKIWEALPYSKQELLEHVQKHMQSWMNWDNNRRAAPGVKTWQLDHIIPKVTFQYTSTEDEDFQKCWSLSNFRPIEALVNIIKSDHREIQSVVSSIFRGCVVHKRKSKFWANYFNYTPEEARKHLEKQFTDGLLWSNYNKIWEIDHIIPRAALPFEAVNDDNFKKLWSLENLRPAFLSENRSKASKYENKKYFAFDIKSPNMVSIDANLATG